MTPIRVDAALAVLVRACAPVLGASFTETFEGGSNVGGWLYGGPGETIETTGGNPGAYLPSPSLERNITGIGIDVITMAVTIAGDVVPVELLDFGVE